MSARIYMEHTDFAFKYPDKCCAEVSRKGESEPCDKTAYAMVLGYADEYESGAPDHWWPVCIHHARGRQLVPLSRLMERLKHGTLSERR